MYTDDDIFDTLFCDFDDDPENDNAKPLPPLTPSYEQQLVVNHLVDGDNVVVDSVSGSGKSTTILSCAEQIPNKTILQLTYNAMLRKDVHEKVVARELLNISVHTYHSLAVKYYHKDAHKDSILRKILSANLSPLREIPTIDIVCLDESQDMTLLYYLFIVKFLRDMGGRIQVCVLGDYKQGIYQFKGADIRFLTKAAEIWSKYPLLSSPVFHHCALTTSYRVTDPMADFVNEVMLGTKRLYSCKLGSPVQYIRNHNHNIITIIKSRIAALLDSGESPSSIFILSASTKSKLVRKIENFLVERGIPCFVSMQDGEVSDERVITGKVVFTTFHSVKGRERKHVFVVGFDQSYFSNYAPELMVNECPNTLYVACTRGTENLYVFESAQHRSNRPLEFLQKTHFDMQDSSYVNFYGIPQKNFESEDTETYNRDGKFHNVTPSSLVRFIPENVVDEITPLMERIFVIETPAIPELVIDIPIVIRTSRGFHEDVSALNGIAIPSIYYDYLYKRMASTEQDARQDIQPGFGAKPLLSVIHDIMDETNNNEYAYLKQMVANLPDTFSTPEEYLYLSNIYVSVSEKLYFQLNQIGKNDYGWLSSAMIRECIDRFEETVGRECSSTTDVIIEQSIIDFSREAENEALCAVLAPFFDVETAKFRFSARTDLITLENIWEMKCTTTISMEHQLQLLLYAWIWTILYPEKPREFRIFNIRSGEVQRLTTDINVWTTIVVALLKGKYTKLAEKTDEEFLEGTFVQP